MKEKYSFFVRMIGTISSAIVLFAGFWPFSNPGPGMLKYGSLDAETVVTFGGYTLKGPKKVLGSPEFASSPYMWLGFASIALIVFVFLAYTYSSETTFVAEVVMVVTGIIQVACFVKVISLMGSIGAKMGLGAFVLLAAFVVNFAVAVFAMVLEFLAKKNKAVAM